MGRTRNLANLVSDNILSIDTSGNIGLGNETPTKTLDVVGILSTTTFSGGHYDGIVSISNNFTENFTTTGIITTTGTFIGDASGIAGVGFTCAAILADVKAQNTNGGTPANIRYQQRDLNTIVSDPHNIIVSLSSNKFTLGPGVYQIHYITPGFRVNSTQGRIRNVTDDEVLTESYSGNNWTQQDGYYVGVNNFGKTGFIQWESGNKEFELQFGRHYYNGDYMFGLAANISGVEEHYSSLYILKGSNKKGATNGSIVTSNLIYHLDANNSNSYGGSGSTWTDLVAGSNNATINGATYTLGTGNQGYYFDFDGTDDYVNMPQDAYVLGTGFTIEIWARNDNASMQVYDANTGNSVYSSHDGTYSLDEIIHISQDKVELRSSSTIATPSYSPVPVVQEWHHYVLTSTYSGSGPYATVKVYIDKKEVVNSSVVDYNINANANGSALGRRSATSGRLSYWDGQISIFRVYSEPLTTTQIEQNYYANSGRYI